MDRTFRNQPGYNRRTGLLDSPEQPQNLSFEANPTYTPLLRCKLRIPWSSHRSKVMWILTSTTVIHYSFNNNSLVYPFKSISKGSTLSPPPTTTTTSELPPKLFTSCTCFQNVNWWIQGAWGEGAWGPGPPHHPPIRS